MLFKKFFLRSALALIQKEITALVPEKFKVFIQPVFDELSEFLKLFVDKNRQNKAQITEYWRKRRYDLGLFAISALRQIILSLFSTAEFELIDKLNDLEKSYRKNRKHIEDARA